MDEPREPAGDKFAEYPPGLRGLSPVDQACTLRDAPEHHARPLVRADDREPRLLGGRPGHHPRDQHPPGREQIDQPPDVAGIEGLGAVHHHDDVRRRGGHTLILGLRGLSGYLCGLADDG